MEQALAWHIVRDPAPISVSVISKILRRNILPGVALFLVETNARMLSVGEYYQQGDHHNFWIFANFKQKHECNIRRI